jgi:glycosyltransferase involved in cell wall biosynthesis
LNPFFSIIVPLFNGAATLPLLLDSITMQHCRDFEVIFMDGASTDNSPALIAEFQEISGDPPGLPRYGMF